MGILFETERLIVREVDEAVEHQFDDAANGALSDDPFKDVPADAVEDVVKDVDALREYLERLAASRDSTDRMRFGAWNRDGALVAYSAGSAWSSGTPELQITVATEHQGKGYGTEFLSALIPWAFEHYDIRHFIYRHLINNDRSAHLAKKLGGVLQEPKSLIEGLTSRTYYIYR